MIDYPGSRKMVIAGEKLELQWKYQLNMSTKWKVSLYEYDSSQSIKFKILMLLETGLTVSNPRYLPLIVSKVNMELSHNKAKISVSNTTFEVASGYGIMFQSTGHGHSSEEQFEKFTEIHVIGRL